MSLLSLEIWSLRQAVLVGALFHLLAKLSAEEECVTIAERVGDALQWAIAFFELGAGMLHALLDEELVGGSSCDEFKAPAVVHTGKPGLLGQFFDRGKHALSRANAYELVVNDAYGG